MPVRSNFSNPDIINQNQKTAIYIRVSTHFQVDKDSLQVQRRDLIAYSEMILGIKNYVVLRVFLIWHPFRLIISIASRNVESNVLLKFIKFQGS